VSTDTFIIELLASLTSDCCRRGVGLSVGHVREPSRNSQTDQDVIWGKEGVDTGGRAQEAIYEMGSSSPKGKGQFGGCLPYCKTSESSLW